MVPVHSKTNANGSKTDANGTKTDANGTKTDANGVGALGLRSFELRVQLTHDE